MAGTFGFPNPNPASLQLNVPTQCMTGYTQGLEDWFPKSGIESLFNSCRAHSIQLTVQLVEGFYQVVRGPEDTA